MVQPIGILYEHPEWFRPLFAELDRRGLPYERIAAQAHRLDPAARTSPYRLVVNRVSPSAYLRGNTSAIFQASAYLTHLESIGVPVVNGSRAHTLELSKARQLSLLAQLGLPHPRSRVVNAAVQLEPAADELEYPVIVKPNIGGSGALMRRFDLAAELRQAALAGELDAVFGLDSTAIVQEFHPPAGGSIVRVEALAGEVLYAIRIENDPNQGFNLCPADICQVDTVAPSSTEFEFCPVDAPAKRPLQIEAIQPPNWVAEAVVRIFTTAGTDVGGVEYLESSRDGQTYFYDINALSNFVTDAVRLVGFDPFARFVDFLERRAGLAKVAAVGSA
jgi:hypothetical protein